MSFVLLGKTAEDRLYLVSEIAFETRGEALQELSRITGSAEFAGWDDEIFVIDDRRGAPVVLVRSGEEPPSGAADESLSTPQAEESLSTPQAEESEAPSAVDEPVADESPADAMSAEEPLKEEASPVAEDVASADEAPTAEEPSDEAPTAEEPSDDDEPADETTPGESARESSDVGLKEALLRSADRMEAEGVVVPESIGPEMPEEQSVEDAVPVETQEGDAAVGAWPWDSDEEGKRLDLDGFEESGDDGASLVRASGDDETLSITRPVIMGAYGESESPAPEPELLPEPSLEPEPEGVAAAADEESVGLAEPGPADDAAAAVNEFVELPSDYVDLGSLPQSEVPPATEGAGIDAMTCDDCVYVESCPNKGQSEPSSCGSFQWK